MYDTLYLCINTMYLLRISPHSRYIEIQYILYPLYLVQIQWIQVVSAPGPDTVDTYRTCRLADCPAGFANAMAFFWVDLELKGGVNDE